MASNHPKLGGYDLQFVSEPPDALVCLICTFAARDPYQMDCCGRVYCQLCLSEHKKHSDLCPHCREAGNSFKDKKSDREIKALKVRCANLKNGCPWTSELSHLEDHLEACKHTFIQCTNKCEKDGEVVQLLRKELEDHLKNKCPRRAYRCPHCQQDGEYEERTGEHLEVCEKVVIECPNDGCGAKFRRLQSINHSFICEYEPVACRYIEVGCNERPPRKDKEEHEKNYPFHLHLTVQSVINQKKAIEQLRDTVQQLSSTVQQLEQKIETLKP